MKTKALFLLAVAIATCGFFSCSNVLSEMDGQKNGVTMKSAIDDPDTYNIFLDGLAYSLSLALEDLESARELLAYEFASSGRDVLPLSQLVGGVEGLTELGAIWNDYLMSYYQIPLIGNRMMYDVRLRIVRDIEEFQDMAFRNNGRMSDDNSEAASGFEDNLYFAVVYKPVEYDENDPFIGYENGDTGYTVEDVYSDDHFLFVLECLKGEYDADFDALASAISQIITEDQQFLHMIYEGVLEMFDGDYNILLSDFVGRDAYIKDMLESYGIAVDELIEKYPLIQIAMPLLEYGGESPYSLSYVPPVVYIHEWYEDGITSSVSGYNQYERIFVDAINEPDLQVIVISENERTDLDNPTYPIPGIPTNLTISPSARGIGLSWEHPSSGTIQGYNVYRKSPTDSDFLKIGISLGENNLAYIDQGRDIQAGSIYYYYVTAFNTTGESSVSNTVQIQAPRPAAVSDFEAFILTNTQAELHWDTENADYQWMNISKKVINVDNDYSLLVSLDNNAFHYIDNGIVSGTKVVYQAQTLSSGGSTSTPQYDFIHVPYRNPSAVSPLRIKQIKCDLKAVEGWLRGKPEFLIKVYGVNAETKQPYEIQSELYHKFGSRSSSNNCNLLVLSDWRPQFWGEILSFHVIEDDKNKESTVTMSVQNNFKDMPTLSLQTTINNKEVEFSKRGDDCGSGHLNYYDPIDQIVEFPHYGVKLTMGQ